jgi:hypothetical protein
VKQFSFRPSAELPSAPADAEPPAPEAPDKPPARKPPAVEPETPGWQTCRVQLWSGYVKKQFFAESRGGEWIAQSPFFRIEKGSSVEESQNASEAFDSLLETLTDAGWKVAARKAGSWEVTLKRRAGKAQLVK